MSRLAFLLDGPRRAMRGMLYELRVRRDRNSLPAGAPRLVIFPSNLPWDPASNLRAYTLVPELQKLGWRVLLVPEPLSLAARRRLLALERPDVVLMQQTRHLLNQPQLYPGTPCVLDADDADCLDPRHRERIAAAAAAAAAVVGGSRFVAGCLGSHNSNHHVIWTCTPAGSPPPVAPRHRRPILAWAHASPLGYPKEASLVAAVVRSLAALTSFEFWLFGTDEAAACGYLQPLRAAGAVCRAWPPMSYDDYLRTTGECAVGMQPVCVESEFSRGKSFGKLLAYLAGQVAVVASDAVDHSLFFRGENGCVVPNDVDAWVAAIRPLLEDPDQREAVAVAGYRDFRTRLTTDVHARLLDPILRGAIGKRAMR